ncbi:hypothetical protein FCR2A7T_20470 [Flavobacterium cauense R2A-7]|uniref:DUF4199 domain-containing protein n=1 Tax=Flavobacterium cauense R2A-7 TaxID=1341154 RepID=V6RYA8_9FLAO|nr:hypothetical protein [Flavobacterium cauense]ESU19433.1 hypothetical protein FCR2A7T_20470 [Flavobacterium cauense R2A-7]KGO80393.1 hypothetical protein Q762_12250 [Flavobacterium cauense R2A-7]TWI08309.1 hypothetical protein IP98_02832 [Flavobacterium cauense R2A-7]
MFKSREFINGFIIFLGIGIYFLLMEFLGFSDVFFLRILNVFIIVYGINRTLKANVYDGHNDYLFNLTSGALTAFVGVILSIIALNIYIHIRGGEAYIKTLSEAFLFGGSPSVYQYCAGLLFEGLASSAIAAFTLMQYWKGKTVRNGHLTH